MTLDEFNKHCQDGSYLKEYIALASTLCVPDGLKLRQLKEFHSDFTEEEITRIFNGLNERPSADVEPPDCKGDFLV